MALKRIEKVVLHNKVASLTVDLYGGAIVDFRLKNRDVNPLSFSFSAAEMPDNNQGGGAPYRGHFLCLGRWGAPTPGEREAGLPHHGQAAHLRWEATGRPGDLMADMQVDSPLEGLRLKRSMLLDAHDAGCQVTESVTNYRSLGRFYNMVQHPTLAAPFLGLDTRVACNAERGFDQAFYRDAEQAPFSWPLVKDKGGRDFDLRAPALPYNSVFSFAVRREAQYGWICAWSREHRLLMGYLWKRVDYPWIHLWQRWNQGRLLYRGIEFGTAGIHQPFDRILETGVRLLGVPSVAYIDAGETVTRRYGAFLFPLEAELDDIETLEVRHDTGQLVIRHSAGEICLHVDLNHIEA